METNGHPKSRSRTPDFSVHVLKRMLGLWLRLPWQPPAIATALYIL